MNGQIELGAVSARSYFSAIAIALGFVFAFIDELPGNLQETFWHSLKWQLQTCIPMAILLATQVTLLRFHIMEYANPWLRLTVSALIATLFHTPIALAIDVAFGGQDEIFNLSGLISEYLAMAPPVALCWLTINAPWASGLELVKKSPSSLQPKDEVESEYVAPFYCLLQKNMRGELLYLEAELHYLAVVTTAGRSLILYNLRDAIQQLPEEIGVQTHRGYWVVLKEVRGLQRVSRQGAVTMSNGDKVPVSRRNYALVEKVLSTSIGVDSCPNEI